jgi:hypothetical protein
MPYRASPPSATLRTAAPRPFALGSPPSQQPRTDLTVDDGQPDNRAQLHAKQGGARPETMSGGLKR